MVAAGEVPLEVGAQAGVVRMVLALAVVVVRQVAEAVVEVAGASRSHGKASDDVSMDRRFMHVYIVDSGVPSNADFAVTSRLKYV